MPRVSIILPVYKTEKFLRRCLDSIVKQTFTDFEVICVDDSTPDNSMEILHEYASSDPRFKIISQINLGQAGARNSGVVASMGEFILFIDSDDCIHHELVASVYDLIIEHKADLVCFSYKMVNETEYPHDEIVTKDYYITDQPMLHYFNRSDHVIRDFAGSKFYRKSLLYDITFPDIVQKDIPYCLSVLERNHITVITDMVLYYYTIHSDNPPIITTKNIADTQIMFHTVIEKFRDSKYFTLICQKFIPKKLKDQYLNITNADVADQKDLWITFAKQLSFLKSMEYLTAKNVGLRWYLKYNYIITKYS